jgi:hypothetical protein
MVSNVPRQNGKKDSKLDTNKMVSRPVLGEARALIPFKHTCDHSLYLQIATPFSYPGRLSLRGIVSPLDISFPATICDVK